VRGRLRAPNQCDTSPPNPHHPTSIMFADNTTSCCLYPPAGGFGKPPDDTTKCTAS